MDIRGDFLSILKVMLKIIEVILLSLIFTLPSTPAWAVGETFFGIFDSCVSSQNRDTFGRPMGPYQTINFASDAHTSRNDTLLNEKLSDAVATGWPMHLVVLDDNTIVGALPMSNDEVITMCKSNHPSDPCTIEWIRAQLSPPAATER